MGLLKRECFAQISRRDISPVVHDWLGIACGWADPPLLSVATLGDTGWIVKVPKVVCPAQLLDDRLEHPVPVKLYALLQEARHIGADIVLIGGF